MTFPLTPSVPYSNGVGTVDSSVLNVWRTAISQAGDFAGGGSYAPASQIVIGGAGLKLTGATALELDATSVSKLDSGGVFDIYGTVNVESGGFITVLTGGEISVAGTSALATAKIYVGAYGLVQVDANGSIVVLSGGLLQVSSGGAFNLYGGQAIESGGFINVNSGGLIDVLSGGLVKVESGGEIEVKSGGEILVDAGGTLTTAQPAMSANPGQNNITVTSVPKCWANVTIGGGPSCTVNDGLNISSTVTFPAFGATQGFKFTFTQAMANTNYAVTVAAQALPNGGPGGNPQHWDGYLVAQTTTDFTIVFRDTYNNTYSTPSFADIIVCGRQ